MIYHLSNSPLQNAIDEFTLQLAEYRRCREAAPALFGNHDGCWDNTPEDTGPMPHMVIYKDAAAASRYSHRIFWGIHKHPWPLQYWYCFTCATDSRGERTAETVQFDIRELPKRYIGRYNLKYSAKCDRRAHIKILERACADNFDFAAHAIAQSVIAANEAAQRAEIQAEADKARAVQDAHDLEAFKAKLAAMTDEQFFALDCWSPSPLLSDDEVPF